VISFGFGTQCMGNTTPFLLRLVVDDRTLVDNQPGSVASRRNDEDDLLAQPTAMGNVIAQGSGDVVGDDGVPDLVFRDVDYAFRGLRGPAVEILSGGWLRALLARVCPGWLCADGMRDELFSDGDYHVLALRLLEARVRRIVPSSGLAVRFGSALAVADLSGDGRAEVLVGSADDSFAGPFAGAVRVYRGGEANAGQEALLRDPWMVAVGDIAEPAGVGASVAATSRGGVWLLAGAPNSTRNGTGGDLGHAFRWRIEGAR
jgi:hypothetical protein